MKPNLLFLALSSAATLLTSSCVEPMYGIGGPISYGSRVTSYTALPRGYAGDAYFYNGRYYSGGNYQTGSYAYQGRSYSDRYYHNGQYLYGGNHRHYQGQSLSRSTRPSDRSSSFRRSSSSASHLRHPAFGHRL